MNLRTALAASLVTALLAAGCSSGETPPAPTPEVETTAAGETTPAVTESTTPSAPAETTTAAGTTPADEESPTGKATLEGDEGERNAAVVPAFHAYWDVINKTYADGGAAGATEEMNEVMTGQQLEFWVATFTNWKKQGNRYEGENKVLYATPKLVALKPGGGTADVEFCVDMSETRAFDAQGRPLNKDGLYQSGVAVLEWIDGGWKVAGHRQGSGNKDAC